MTLKRNVRYVFKDEDSKKEFATMSGRTNLRIIDFIETHNGITIAEDADESSDSGFYFNDVNDILDGNNFISTEESKFFKEWVDIEDLGLIAVTKSPVVEVKVPITKDNYKDIIDAITKVFK